MTRLDAETQVTHQDHHPVQHQRPPPTIVNSCNLHPARIVHLPANASCILRPGRSSSVILQCAAGAKLTRLQGNKWTSRALIPTGRHPGMQGMRVRQMSQRTKDKVVLENLES